MIPKVSVVMPAYNAGKYIRQTLDSLIAQTFTDWECIVVDDASTDGTLQIVEEYIDSDPRIRCKTLETNTGAGKVPRDIAITMADGEWIFFLDSDDVLAADAMERSVSRQSETQADVVLIKMVVTDENGGITGFTIPSKEFDFSSELSGLDATKLTIGPEWEINCNGGLFSKRLFDRRHPVENYVCADEYDGRQLLIAADKVAFVNADYYHRQYATSLGHTFSVKTFHPLHVNKWLSDLIRRTYPNDDAMQAKMNLQRFENIVHSRFILLHYQDKLSGEEKRNLNQLMKENYYDISMINRCRANMDKAPVKRFLLGINYTLFCVVTYIWAKIKT